MSNFLNRDDRWHYANLQNVHRSKFDMSRGLTGTMNAGLLYPLGRPIWVNPGDTWNQKINYLIRMSTPISPIMGSIYFETASFFVPMRQVWKHTNEFFGENRDGSWRPTTEYKIPSLDIHNGVKPKSLMDYFEIPIITKEERRGSHPINILLNRSYCHIWNEFFRDQNCQDPIHIDEGDGAYNNDFDESLTVRGGPLLPVNKYHDYFTSVAPEPQKGPDVPLGFGLNAHIYAQDPTLGLTNAQYVEKYGNYSPILGNGALDLGKSYTLHAEGVHHESSYGQDVDGYDVIPIGDSNKVTSNVKLHPLNLVADIGELSGLNVNNLRLAMATQRFYEIQTHGSRYTEIIRNFFGVSSDDLRIQRPELLAYSKNPINIHQIVQQSESNSTPLGTTGAMSLTVGTDGHFVKSFSEHGYIITVGWVRYKHSYSQGLNKFWTKLNTFDYYFPTFDRIGYQPIYTSEIYLKDNNKDVFGYNEAWIEYRTDHDGVVGEMRPDYPQSLAVWHLGDYYTEKPIYNHDWIKEDMKTIDRTLQVTSEVADQFQFDIYFERDKTAVMSMFSTPSSLGM